MEILGYIASILIGISLGLIGGGGSILTVPVLVYLFGIEASLSTSYSLFVVGVTSLVGSILYIKKGLVSFKTVLYFGLPSIFSIFLTKQWIVPSIPTTLIQIGNFTLTKNNFLLFLFAILMLTASYSMIQKKTTNTEEQNSVERQSAIKIVLQGLLVGLITGLVGAGGGFIIIPVLVNFFHIPVKKAIGTSLMIITINSLSGFLFSLNEVKHFNLLFSIAAIAVIGILIGSYLSNFIDGKKLKTSFGWFVLLMGVYIILKESIFA